MDILDNVGEKLEELNPLDNKHKKHGKKSGRKGGKSSHSKSRGKKK